MTLVAPESHDDPVASLSIWIDQTGSRCTIRLAGSLDSSTVSLFDSRVDLVLCRWCDELVIDLSALQRIDGVGARLLTGFGHYASARGARFSLVKASDEVAALISAAEIDLAS